MVRALPRLWDSLKKNLCQKPPSKARTHRDCQINAFFMCIHDELLFWARVKHLWYLMKSWVGGLIYGQDLKGVKRDGQGIIRIR